VIKSNQKRCVDADTSGTATAAGVRALQLTVVVVQRHQSKVKGVYGAIFFQGLSTEMYTLETTNGRLLT
jgi:hypothetical protein